MIRHAVVILTLVNKCQSVYLLAALARLNKDLPKSFSVRIHVSPCMRCCNNAKRGKRESSRVVCVSSCVHLSLLHFLNGMKMGGQEGERFWMAHCCVPIVTQTCNWFLNLPQLSGKHHLRIFAFLTH